jgi:predicted metal-dependent peptidase
MFNCLDLYSEQCNGEETLDIIWCDSKIARMEKIARGANVKPAGGGGTSFAPVTNYLVEHDGEYSGLIYFTDGYCDDFGTNPNIPCIWLLPAPCKSFDPPFGATVVFND